MRLYFLLIITLLFVNCGSVRDQVSQAPEDLIKAIFGDNVKIAFNSSRSHALCQIKEERTLSKPGNALDFGVMDLSGNRMVYREQKYNANVNWVNDSVIHVRSLPGVRSKDTQTNMEMMNYYINVKSLVKTSEYPK